MDNPATLSDVQGVIERPLTSEEERSVPNWLGVAWRELRRVVPAIDARNDLPESDPSYLATEDVKDVVVAMVERKVRNPDGLRSWGGDDYQQSVDPAMASGRIYVTQDEADKLAPPAPSYGDGIFSIPLGAR